MLAEFDKSVEQQSQANLNRENQEREEARREQRVAESLRTQASTLLVLGDAKRERGLPVSYLNVKGAELKDPFSVAGERLFPDEIRYKWSMQRGVKLSEDDNGWWVNILARGGRGDSPLNSRRTFLRVLPSEYLLELYRGGAAVNWKVEDWDPANMSKILKVTKYGYAQPGQISFYRDVVNKLTQEVINHG